MRLLLVVGLCFSVSGWASDEDVKAHESKLSSAKKWSQVEENLKVWIPGSVVKEFATAVHEKPYPKIRKLKYGLQLIQEDGLRVTIQLKSNGRISFNGKDWRFKPLLPIDQQVSQLAMFLSGDHKRAGLELFSSANASGDVDDDAYGAAAFAFAAANAWKADACDEANLTDELIEDCTLMAVAMRFEMDSSSQIGERKFLNGKIQRVNLDTGADEGGFRPIKLQCPQKNNNKLVLISKAEDGKELRYFIQFNKSGDPIHVGYDLAEKGQNFKPFKDLKVEETKDNAKMKKLFDFFVKKGKLIETEVCRGPKSQYERYVGALESNRQLLHNVKYQDDSSDDNAPQLEAI